MPTIINGLALALLIERDGLPRVALADDGSQHVMYLENGEPPVRSMLAADWPGPLPTDPTPLEIQAAIDARAVRTAQQSNEVAALKQTILNVVQSAVGVHVNSLTNLQLLALLKALLWESGVFGRDGIVRDPREWLDR